MSWSETVLMLVGMLSVPVGLGVYYLGEAHGMSIRKMDQRHMLEGRTWLWVDGRFYPVDATDEQMEEVRKWEGAYRRELGVEVDR